MTSTGTGGTDPMGAGTLFDYLSAARRTAERSAQDGDPEPSDWSMPAASSSAVLTASLGEASLGEASLGDAFEDAAFEDAASLDLTADPPTGTRMR